MNFSIRANDKYDLRQNFSEVTNERLKDFVSIGIRAISSQYGFDGATWSVDIKQDKKPSPEVDILPAMFGFPAKRTILDYKLTLKLKSPISASLNIVQATKNQAILLGIDEQVSQDYDYRAELEGSVILSLRSGINDTIFFDINAVLSLKRKSHFADSKHFEEFETINQNGVEELRQAISNLLLQAYFETLNSYGFKVKKGAS